MHANSFFIGDGSRDISLCDNIAVTKDANTYLISDNSSEVSQNKIEAVIQNGKDDLEAHFKNTLTMLPELEALYLTFKRQTLIEKAYFQYTIVTQLRKHDMITL